MLISFLKGILILLFSFLVSLLIYFLISLEGQIVLNIYDKEIYISFLTAGILFILFFIFFIIVIYFFGFLNFILKLLNGEKTFINNFIKKSRKRKGYKALTNAFFSLDSGENSSALIHSKNAIKYLKNDRLALLMNAKALEINGFHSKASEVYKNMLDIKASKLVAMNGLVKNKIAKGENNLALKFAYKNFELNSKNSEVIEKLYDLQIKEKDWKGAINTLYKKQKFFKLSRDILKRKESIFLFLESLKLKNENQIAASLNLVKESLRLSPDLVPAICHHAKLELSSSNLDRAEKILIKGWKLCPHPDISETFSNLINNESNSIKYERFQKLLKKEDNRLESLVLKIQLKISVEDFPSAMRDIKKIENIKSDIRLYLMMIAVEKGLGASEEKVKDLLSKAILCETNPEWICDNCNNFGIWEAICSKCEKLDTYSWKKNSSFKNNYLKNFFIPFVHNSFQLDNTLQDDLKPKKQEKLNSEVKYKSKLKKNEKKLHDKKGEIVKSAREII